ncbi:MAG: AarF/UbiB family protein [Candidatus Sumerlaeia bacterium]|nr:AarF/UbiB family protein [Candidatus Sumerlaeia bacterium]
MPNSAPDPTIRRKGPAESGDGRRVRLFPPVLRPVRVFLRLLPFLVSFARDFRAHIFFGPPADRTEEEHRRRAVEITATIASLGATFIKGIQVLAVREDLIPLTYTREFKRLQDQVPPFPGGEARSTIQREFGKRVEDLFERFDAEPIAAASIGQVHRARIDGREVAVKVLRPGIEEQVETDLAVLAFILFLFETFLDNYLVRSFRAIYDEFSRVIREEMDYRLEAKNNRRLRAMFQDDPRVIIPRCAEGFVRRRVIAFDFVEGVRIDDREGVAALGVDPRGLLQTLTEIYLQMALRHGFVHADPHPGNLLVCEGGRIAILDYGMAVDIDAETRKEMLRIVFHVVREDVDAIVDSFYRLKMVDPEINRATLLDAAERLLHIRIRTDATPRQIREIALEILQTFYRFPLRLPEQLVYLSRAAALVEGIGYVYDPNFNAIRFGTPIVRDLLLKEPLLDSEPLAERLKKGGRAALRLARGVARTINRIERDDIRVRIHRADIDEIEALFTSLMRRLLAGLLATIVAAAGVAVYLHTGLARGLLFSLPLAAALLFLGAFLPLRRKPRRKSPFL